LAGMEAGLRRKSEEKAVSLRVEIDKSLLVLHGSADPTVKELTFSFRKKDKDLLVPYTIRVPLRDGKFSVASPQSLPEGPYDVSVTDEKGGAYKSPIGVYIPSKKQGGA